jgi:addiction module RelE/StbE family toxin
VKVVWTPEAENDRDEIWNYIFADNPQAAVRMDELFSKAAARLADFPEMGHDGRIRGTREFVIHENYRLIYEIEGQTVWILALVHSARQWPPVRK